jgi:hypothetical protein
MISKLWMTLALTSLAVPCISQELTARPSQYEVFTDKAGFLAAIGEVVFQGFESYPTNECSSGGPSPTTFLESESFTVTTVPAESGTSFLCTGTTAGGSPGPTEGINTLVAGSNTGSTWTLEFILTDTRPAYAIGLYLTDAAERGDAIFVTSGGDEIVMARCCRTGTSPVFFGLISNKPFRSFELRNTGAFDGWGIDELMLGIGRRLN